MSFVHLHVHSTYSLTDGIIHVADLPVRAAALGMPAVALTDHGNLAGAVKFQLACDQAGVQPIFGTEFYLDPVSRFRREGRAPLMHHLILLAKDAVGLRHLIRLNVCAHAEGFYYKPRIDWELLTECRAGLVCLSACLKGHLAFWWAQEDERRLQETAERYARLFGEDFYLELGTGSMAEQVAYNTVLIDLGRRLGLPLVVTCDVHYLERQDAALHDAVLCLQTHAKLTDAQRLRLPTDEYYLWAPEELERWCAHWGVSEAMAHTLDIARRCQARLKTDRLRLPYFSHQGAP